MRILKQSLEVSPENIRPLLARGNPKGRKKSFYFLTAERWGVIVLAPALDGMMLMVTYLRLDEPMIELALQLWPITNENMEVVNG